MVVTQNKIITVFNKKGDRFGSFVYYYGKGDKLKDLNISIYDENGNLVEKIKQKRIQDLPADDGFSLYTDSRVKYFSYLSNTYPYTIKITYTYQTGNTAFIPSFIPVWSYNLGVENSSFTITHPVDIKLFTSIKKSEFYHLQSDIHKTRAVFTLTHARPSQKEPFSPPLYDIIPHVKFRLSKFSLLGLKGHVNTWEEMGEWINNYLLKNLNTIPETTKNEILRLTKDIPDEYEKAKKIYEFMQQKTRYVSIQIGVGGWRPMPAEEVDQKAYGDCKALVNYTKSLMDVAGIKTYYTLVYAGEKRDLDPQTVGLQGNHAILMFPYKNDTIWLECTNHKAPFGYLGSFTDDRRVFVVNPGKSKLVKTTRYKDEKNIINTRSEIKIDENLSLIAKTEIQHCGLAYDDVYYLENLKKDEIKLHYKRKFDEITDLSLDHVAFQNNKDSFCFKEQFNLSTKKFIKKFVDNEYMLRLNLFSVLSGVPPETKNRKLPVYIRSGFIKHDSIVYTLPEGYVFDYLPENKKMESRFGTYEVKITKKSNTHIIYERKFFLRSGTYPKNTYEAFRKFLMQIQKYDKKKATLKKV